MRNVGKKSVVVVVLLVMCMVSIASANWTAVGGMGLSYVAQPVTPTYDWFLNGPDGGNVQYGGAWYGGPPFVWPGDGGTHAGVLAVDNSIGSYDAYITQTLLFPAGSLDTVHGGAYTGTLGQQWMYFSNAAGGTTGFWVEFSYGTGEVDHMEQAAGSAWNVIAPNIVVDGAPLTEVTMKIGLLKDAGATTGSRSLMLEDWLLWAWALPYAGQQAYAQWDNFNFDTVPEPATISLLAFGCVALLRRRR